MIEDVRHGDFPTAFEAASDRLMTRLRIACAPGIPWPERAAAGVRAAFDLAATEPDTVHLLTNGALLKGDYGAARYDRLLVELAELLATARHQDGRHDPLPSLMERALVGGVVMVVAERIAHDRSDDLPALAPEAIEFLLTPYLGAEAAKAAASSHDHP